MNPTAKAEIVMNGLPYRLPEGVYRIGHKEGNEIIIDDRSVSPFHATLLVKENGVILTDQGSAQGTFVNGQRIIAAPVKDGDRLTLGSVEVAFRSSLMNSPSEISLRSPPSLSATSSAKAGSLGFSWWPQSRNGSRAAIIGLSLTFVIFSLGTPFAGILAAGLVFLLMAFYRWLTVKTVNAFRQPAASRATMKKGSLSKEAIAACGALGFGVVMLLIILMKADSAKRTDELRPKIEELQRNLGRQTDGT